jgi:bifunctional non-homologous end joining protein LigD
MAEVIQGSPVRCSEAFDTDPEVLLTQIKELRLEGIVAKKRTSTYDAGKRSPAWLKFKIYQQEDFVIGGFLAGRRLSQFWSGFGTVKR